MRIRPTIEVNKGSKLGCLHSLLRALAWETGIEIEIPVNRENPEIFNHEK